VLDSSARQIGTQIAALQKGFLPFDQVSHDPGQLRVDYERLRLTWELTRDIGLERDLEKLLQKIPVSIAPVAPLERHAVAIDTDLPTLAHEVEHARRDGASALAVCDDLGPHVAFAGLGFGLPCVLPHHKPPTG